MFRLTRAKVDRTEGPIRINHGSVSEVESPDELAALTNEGRHVVLRFQSVSREEKSALIRRLAADLPDHSVFDSGADPAYTQITVKPVVARSRVLERRDQVVRAIAEYRAACANLVEQYRADNLGRECRAIEHGGQCRFENRRTGQVVEAQYAEWAKLDYVDPYFFALFVRSTAGLEAVAELITDNYHDAMRILLVVTTGAGSGDVASRGGAPSGIRPSSSAS